MTRGHIKVFTIIVFFLTAVVIGALIFLPKDFFSPRKNTETQTRVVIPQTTGSGGEALDFQRSGEEARRSRISLDEGEVVLDVLTRDFDGDINEEQIIAFRNQREVDSPIRIAYVDNDGGSDYRVWSAASAVSRSGTLILYSEDLIGDGGICVLVSGMNGANEQTLTVFRKNNGTAAFSGEPFSKIAEFLIEGSIIVEDAPAYQQGRSLTISTFGRDYDSANLLDQIEVTYAFNRGNGLYEQSRVVKIPGRQIEQQRLRELLNGNPEQFETFIGGMWYRDDGPRRQYLYFNNSGREIIFYDTRSEEVFTWQDSISTRYGLHINSRNISLTKLRRTINIDLVSLENIHIRVYQDAYLRGLPNTVWDGSYQRLETVETVRQENSVAPYIEGNYSGTGGAINFSRSGAYVIQADGAQAERRGKYVFFNLGADELLELRPETTPHNGKAAAEETPDREIFRVVRSGENPARPGELALTRVRISTKGIQDLHEAAVVLNRS
ncbi:MAG: pallilysin-related adhesin [Treponema sp.]|jgi:hypothetical protein|nr:pallilysin-related adhesin [Treponema sp.]